MISSALQSLRSGKPVLIFDSSDREGETDIVVASQFVTPQIIRMMRKNGGGLICTTIKSCHARKIGLPLLEDLYSSNLSIGNALTDTNDMKYDKSSTFSITVNSRDTFTGIPDIDRSKTVNHIADFIGNIKNEKPEDFARIFRAPGHIHLLIATDGYFKNRRGHTELSTYLVEQAGLTPSATIVEMLSDSGYSMTYDETKKYADQNSLDIITGDEIIKYWGENH
ncbi:3,4-dihydroxy-2-butanone-4-phosphate synthase [Acidiplasma sp.]|uniref:3,4-dihydroxy-2-butanone-4-phosphate synthase n=1 Tax=Acidiplasma sp. TaxID=1872114 RepID=UPI0025836528|nr:3,4-dihydroxy-2-butanone-4-phosphate synthase [Acidiplasma sp.]